MMQVPERRGLVLAMILWWLMSWLTEPPWSCIY